MEGVFYWVIGLSFSGDELVRVYDTHVLILYYTIYISFVCLTRLWVGPEGGVGYIT